MRQRGSTLILVIGIVATLLILGAALVALTVNMMHGTSTEVTQVKAFNVAEAGLDAGQQALWLNWPATASPTPSPAVTPSVFRSNFPKSSYPDPASGQFIDVAFYDDTLNPANPDIRRGVSFDENGNGRMWIESRGATGPRAAKVMALAQKVQYQPVIQGNVALATQGLLDTDGGGSQPVFGLDPPATAASVYCGSYLIKNNTDIQPGISNPPITGATADAVSQIFPDEVLMYLIATANGAGKEYATAVDVPAAAWSTDPRIIVIDSGGIDLKDAPNTDPSSSPATIWSENNPGILIVLDGNLESTGQNKTLYGIVYLNSGLILGGNAEFHGMVVARASAWLHGTRSINYNQTVMDNLNKPITLSVKLVPNTWRELHP
jgi:hypothetical protein